MHLLVMINSLFAVSFSKKNLQKLRNVFENLTHPAWKRLKVHTVSKHQGALKMDKDVSIIWTSYLSLKQISAQLESFFLH